MAGDKEIERIKEIIGTPDQIRNIGIVAHIDHGKTTLSDNLLARAGMISDELAGNQLFMDYDDQEQERGITIYAANVSMVHEYDDDTYLINLIDTPGHVDFGGDVTRAMRAVDGCVVVVDAVDGVMPQTEAVLRQALEERVKPVLFINKVDRLINELQLDSDEMQNRFMQIIAEVNSLIEKIAPEDIARQWKVSVEDGKVAFGSALYNWATSKTYMEETGVDFKQIYDLCEDEDMEALASKAPVEEVVLNMVVNHLVNPRQAQEYRIPQIWHGDPESDISKAMRSCDASGPLVGVVTNVENDPHAGTIATARLFSGTVEEGDTLYGIGSKSEQTAQQVGIYSGPRKLSIDAVPSGNIVALTGVDYSAGETVVENGMEIEPFEQIEHIFEPVVTKSLEPKRTADLPKLIEALRARAKEDNTIQISIDEETGETLVSGLGELHIEAKIERYLEEKGIDIEVSKPIVVYRESIADASDEMMGKSPNRHNKFYMTVEPIENDVYEVLQEGDLPEGKVRSQDETDIRDILTEAGMDKDEAENVAYIANGNLFLDMTRGVQYLNEIEELLHEAFQEVVDEGPLSAEPCVRLKTKIHDASLHEDAVHRGPAQVIPAVKDALVRALLDGEAQLWEPKQILRIDTPSNEMGGAMGEVSNRRGEVLNMDDEGDSAIITAKVPVAEMFGFEADLKSATQGKGFYSLKDQVFEPLPRGMQEDVIMEIRERKGMKKEIPQLGGE